MESNNHHIEENVEIINKAWFKEILDYCDSAVCEPRDLINAHAFLRVLDPDIIIKQVEKNIKSKHWN